MIPRTLRTTSLLLLLAPLAGCPMPTPTPGAYQARVVKVADGDTLTVVGAGRQTRIRLHGIDSPERRQDFGERARRFTADRTAGRVVTIRPVERDRYGRTVAVVVLPDGSILNRDLVRAGLAWWYRPYAPADRTLAALERSARRDRVGLWSRPNPVPPWEYRAGVRSKPPARRWWFGTWGHALHSTVPARYNTSS